MQYNFFLEFLCIQDSFYITKYDNTHIISKGMHRRRELPQQLLSFHKNRKYVYWKDEQQQRWVTINLVRTTVVLVRMWRKMSCQNLFLMSVVLHPTREHRFCQAQKTMMT